MKTHESYYARWAVPRRRAGREAPVAGSSEFSEAVGLTSIPSPEASGTYIFIYKYIWQILFS